VRVGVADDDWAGFGVAGWILVVEGAENFNVRVIANVVLGDFFNGEIG
jgi:hypothetical protein